MNYITIYICLYTLKSPSLSYASRQDKSIQMGSPLRTLETWLPHKQYTSFVSESEEGEGVKGVDKGGQNGKWVKMGTLTHVANGQLVCLYKTQ